MLHIRTNEAHGPAEEGVEAAPPSADVALRFGTRLQFGLHAVHQPLPQHDLQRDAARERPRRTFATKTQKQNVIKEEGGYRTVTGEGRRRLLLSASIAAKVLTARSEACVRVSGAHHSTCTSRLVREERGCCEATVYVAIVAGTRGQLGKAAGGPV